MLFPFSPSAWIDRPKTFTLEPGQVFVFRLNLDDLDSIQSADWDCLSAEERGRAARLRGELLQRRFSSAHAQVRRILAACLRCQPAELQFQSGPHGKPALVGNQVPHFNLSHSQGSGLLAVSQDQEVGVDIEGWRPNIDRKALAGRFFTPSETNTIEGLPQDLQVSAFFACWTRKEAYIKARGGGLSIPLDSFEVSVIPGEPVVLHDPSADRAPSRQWNLFDIQPGAGFSAALAVEGAVEKIHLWDWQVALS